MIIKPINESHRHMSHNRLGTSLLSHFLYLKYNTAKPTKGNIIARMVPEISTRITGLGKIYNMLHILLGVINQVLSTLACVVLH